MRSMVDSDNVPHLPKLGKALNKFFIETYWAYPGAIFIIMNLWYASMIFKTKIR